MYNTVDSHIRISSELAPSPTLTSHVSPTKVVFKEPDGPPVRNGSGYCARGSGASGNERKNSYSAAQLLVLGIAWPDFETRPIPPQAIDGTTPALGKDK